MALSTIRVLEWPRCNYSSFSRAQLLKLVKLIYHPPSTPFSSLSICQNPRAATLSSRVLFKEKKFNQELRKVTIPTFYFILSLFHYLMFLCHVYAKPFIDLPYLNEHDGKPSPEWPEVRSRVTYLLMVQPIWDHSKDSLSFKRQPVLAQLKVVGNNFNLYHHGS